MSHVSPRPNRADKLFYAGHAPRHTALPSLTGRCPQELPGRLADRRQRVPDLERPGLVVDPVVD
jgi:hypothetical protein